MARITYEDLPAGLRIRIEPDQLLGICLLLLAMLAPVVAASGGVETDPMVAVYILATIWMLAFSWTGLQLLFGSLELIMRSDTLSVTTSSFLSNTRSAFQTPRITKFYTVFNGELDAIIGIEYEGRTVDIVTKDFGLQLDEADKIAALLTPYLPHRTC